MTTSQCPSESLSARLDAALHTAGGAGKGLVSITLPAPVGRASAFFAQAPAETGYYFATGNQSVDAGVGALASFETAEAQDLSSIEASARELLDHVTQIGIDAATPPLRFFGGMAYEQSPERDGPWHDFARIRFDLPRLRYCSDGLRASLTLSVRGIEAAEPSQRHALRERVSRLLRQLATLPHAHSQARILRRRESPTPEEFRRNVSDAVRVIRAKSDSEAQLEKVVLAREIVLELDRAPSIQCLLDNINAVSPETTRFAFRRGKSVFLGATPECLIMRLGPEVRTEAVAGSARALDVDAAERLMSSEKERHEHALVVRELCHKLEALGAQPIVPEQPSIRQLRHVLHLATSITARVLGAPHVLTLMHYLHPTPAVGGVPDRAAAAFRRAHEPFDRGCYAAPVGWFDAEGDGEFVVGLRSGLLEGSMLRLYAGAGIVRDSDADTEYRETELKLQGLLDSLAGSSDNAITKATALVVSDRAEQICSGSAAETR
ncbi:MAG TPA: isochorismate synthase [Polyangiaceae bacterium]|nr:isochorismate synthase [Polyangiaceae bacterium]